MEGETLHPVPSLPPLITTLFALLHVSTTFVNKYVLSVLKFTYPTIFQGWQMLVGVLVLQGMSVSGYLTPRPSIMNLNRSSWIQWLPAMIFHVIIIYSGSVALAQMPIPVFVAFHNILVILSSITNLAVQSNAVAEILPSPARIRRQSSGESSEHQSQLYRVPLLHDILVVKEVLGKKQWCMLGILATSVIFIYTSDPSVNLKSYYWMGIHIIASGCYFFYERLKGCSLTIMNVDRLYMNCIFSCVILVPFTYLLGDLIAAKEYPFLYFYKFYMGCVASGILGAFLSVTGVKVKEGHLGTPLLGQLTLSAKTCTAVISLFVFDFTPTAEHVFWLVVNYVAATILEEGSTANYVDVSPDQHEV